MKMQKIPDLAFSVADDGSIELEQDCGIGEVDRISLHSCHVRHLFERAGLLLPGDELAKKLAEQLCRTFLAMCDDYRHLSPSLEAEYSRLDAFIDLMPESIFPYHLWSERESKAPADAVAGKPPVATAGDDHVDFALTIQEEQA
jgi:hypothetical protein